MSLLGDAPVKTLLSSYYSLTCGTGSIVVDRDATRIYVSVGQNPGTDPRNPPRDPTGFIEAFDPRSKAASPQGKIALGRLRSLRGMALQNQYAFKTSLVLMIGFWTNGHFVLPYFPTDYEPSTQYIIAEHELLVLQIMNIL